MGICRRSFSRKIVLKNIFKHVKITYHTYLTLLTSEPSNYSMNSRLIARNHFLATDEELKRLEDGRLRAVKCVETFDSLVTDGMILDDPERIRSLHVRRVEKFQTDIEERLSELVKTKVSLIAPGEYLLVHPTRQSLMWNSSTLTASSGEVIYGSLNKTALKDKEPYDFEFKHVKTSTSNGIAHFMVEITFLENDRPVPYLIQVSKKRARESNSDEDEQEAGEMRVHAMEKRTRIGTGPANPFMDLDVRMAVMALTSAKVDPCVRPHVEMLNARMAKLNFVE